MAPDTIAQRIYRRFAAPVLARRQWLLLRGDADTEAAA